MLACACTDFLKRQTPTLDTTLGEHLQELPLQHPRQRQRLDTQYRIDGVLFNRPSANVKTHLVNLSSHIQRLGRRARPEWWLDTSSRQRRCYLSCHGFDMEGSPYRPAAGDDTPTIPAASDPGECFAHPDPERIGW